MPSAKFHPDLVKRTALYCIRIQRKAENADQQGNYRRSVTGNNPVVSGLSGALLKILYALILLHGFINSINKTRFNIPTGPAHKPGPHARKK